MGPPQATDAIKQTIAMGADTGVLLSDRKFAGSDTLATTYILSNAIKKLNSFDIIFCGKQTVDGDTAQVGPGLAARLGIPSITFVRKIEITEDGFFVLHREMQNHILVVKLKPPFLVTVADSANTPRLETLRGKMKANKASIPLWDNNFLEGNEAMIGLDGSPTRVSGTSIPPKKTQKFMLQGDDSHNVEFIINFLREKALL
jgi:electron transfer flavoprotein beta subunit